MALGGLVYAGTEGLGTAFSLPKRKLMILTGPVAAFLCWGAEILPMEQKTVWSLLLAIFLGGLASFGAHLLHNQIRTIKGVKK